MKRLRWLWIVLLLAAVVLFWASRSRGPRAVTVDVANAVERELFQSYVNASGEIVASRYADIGSSVMGRLVDLSVAEGDPVTKGAVLARIDPVQAAAQVEALAARVESLEAETAAATARQLETAKAVERARNLHRQGLLPVADLDAAEAEAETAAAAARAAVRRVAEGRAELARSRDGLAKTEITAPIDGVVTRLSVREGEMVVVGVQNQPGTILMTLSDLSAIDAEVKVAEADVLRLAVGQPAFVTLEALSGRELPGKVIEIGASALPLVDAGAAAREFRVVVRLDDPPAGLRPGLTCDVRILAEEARGVVTVPLQAVVLRPRAEGGEGPAVFRLREGAAEVTPVETGLIGGLDVEIDGLDAGTPVVIGPFQVLRELEDGAAVRRRETEDDG